MKFSVTLESNPEQIFTSTLEELIACTTPDVVDELRQSQIDAVKIHRIVERANGGIIARVCATPAETPLYPNGECVTTGGGTTPYVMIRRVS